MEVVNEHPDANVRKLYAGQVAAEVGLPVADLVRVAEQRTPAPDAGRRRRRGARRCGRTPSSSPSPLLAQDWESIAGWLVEELFADEAHRRAFLALADADGNLDAAIEAADPEAREVLERAAVADLDVDPEAEARNLIAAAVRRELRQSPRTGDPDAVRDDAEARLHLEELADPIPAAAAAEWLLGWLHRRMEQHDRRGTVTSSPTEPPTRPPGGLAQHRRGAVRDGGRRRRRVGVADRAGPPAGQRPRRAGHPRAAPRRAHRRRPRRRSRYALTEAGHLARRDGRRRRVDEADEVDEPPSGRGQRLAERDATRPTSTCSAGAAGGRVTRAAPRGDGSTSDGVRMYLREIGQVDLLTGDDERRLAQLIEEGHWAAERIDDAASRRSTTPRRAA